MRNGICFVLAAVVIAFIGSQVLRPSPTASPPPDPASRLHVEAKYVLCAPTTLWQGSLRRLSDGYAGDGGLPMMEGETLHAGLYYCEKPACIEIDGLGVRQLHQYALLHIERPQRHGGDEEPGGVRVLRASTAPPPRTRHNWQPGANRDWVCRFNCGGAPNCVAVCEDGLCYSLWAEGPPNTPLPPPQGNVIYTSQSSCGIRR